MRIDIQFGRVAVIEIMLPQEYQEVYRRDVQRELARIALIKEARAAQKPQAEQPRAAEHSKHHRRLPILGAVVRATRNFVIEPS